MAAAAPGGALPKATVKLQQTQPMARPGIGGPPSAPVKRPAPASDSQQFYEDKDPEEGLVPLSVACFVFSVILLFVQMFGSDRIATSEDSPIMVPSRTLATWESPMPDGTINSNFNNVLPKLPE